MNILNIIFLYLSIGVITNSDIDLAAKNYIEKYKEFAVIEMYRSGIPASITMAQALHESNFGGSDLANNANNHFGIKCKSYWQGPTYYHEDDDYDNYGKLLESCFRAYDNAFDSYIDHSNFLTQTAHYQHLLNISKDDYKSWAHGLQNSGYATDPLYAKKLIKYIEKYQLNFLDYEPNPFQLLKEFDNN